MKLKEEKGIRIKFAKDIINLEEKIKLLDQHIINLKDHIKETERKFGTND